MPDVIDNNKVGLLIKQLLKEHNMTQDDLAKELNITKSAVSQNLNGKSTFDIQNLVTISKIFDISLEQLITTKSESVVKEIVSEYERLVKKGADAFKNIEVENILISNPDIYGNVLVEYVISYDDVEIFNILHTARIKLLDDTYHKARLIYTKLIYFSLKHHIEDVIRYIDAYVKLFGSLSFVDKLYSTEIWKMLDKDCYQGLVLMLFDGKFSKSKDLILSTKVTKKYQYLSKLQWIENIAKYKLSNILSTIFNRLAFINDYETIIKTFLQYQYDDGILWYIDNLKGELLERELRVSNSSEMLLELANARELNCFIKALNKGLYTDLNKIVTKLINNGNNDFYNYCINEYKNELNFTIIGEAAIRNQNLSLLQAISDKLSQNDLDYFLSLVDKNNIDMMLFLLENNAKFDIGYYNSSTIFKINYIIDELLRRKK